MSSLAEDLGAAIASIFVPSNVIEAQEETQLMLQKRADLLNGSPQIIASSQENKTVATTLQNMNRDVFLSGERDRESGQAVLQAFMDSIEQIPQNIKTAAASAGQSVGNAVSGSVPVWLRWLLGIALVGAILWLVLKIMTTGKAIAA